MVSPINFHYHDLSGDYAKVTRPNQRVFDKGEYTSNYQNSKLKDLKFF